MKQKKKLNKSSFFKVGTIFLGLLIVIIFFVILYLNDYYKADWDAINAFSYIGDVRKEYIDDGKVIYTTDVVEAGLVFYPGGKVEYTAYEPLMEALAAKGIMCVLIKMPFNLAVFDMDAASGIKEKFSNIEEWYIGGHSLGGAMAASYLEDNNGYKGLILLGAYSTVDLSNTSLKVLSIYGSEDKVLNYDKYKSNKKNLPKNFKEVIIDGGNHAYFGMYGEQDVDGKALISNVEQINETALIIDAFV